MLCCGGSSDKIVEKMKLIYNSDKLHSVQSGMVLINHDLFDPKDILYEILVEDYAIWVLEQLMRHSTNTKIIEQVLNVVQLLIPQHIIPNKALPEKLTTWIIQSMRGDLVDVVKYCAIVYAVNKDEKNINLICRKFINDMNLDLHKMLQAQEKGRKIHATFQGRWEVLRVMTQSEKIGDLTRDILGESQGIELLTCALKYYQNYPNDSDSIHHALYICREMSYTKDKLKGYVESKEFMKQLHSFLPVRLKAAGNEKEVLKQQMGVVVQEYTGVLIDMAISEDFQKKIRECDFVASIKSTLACIHNSPEWLTYKRSLETCVLLSLFAILGEMNDMEFTKTSCQRMREEFEQCKDFTGSLHLWCRRCLAEHRGALEEFLDQMNEATGIPEIGAGIEIASQMLKECEKEIKRPSGFGRNVHRSLSSKPSKTSYSDE